MEVVGLILGIPGFIAVAVQFYSSVVRSINNYRNLPKEIDDIIIAISREEGMFARYALVFLGPFMAEGDRIKLVQTRSKSAPEYEQFHAQGCSWEHWFRELERELTEQDGTEEDVGPNGFLLEMSLIKDVVIALEAIKVIRDTYLKPEEDGVVEASEPRDGHAEAIDPTLMRRLKRAVCLAHGTRCAERHTDCKFQFRRPKPPGARSTSKLIINGVHSKLSGELEKLKDRNRMLCDCTIQWLTRNNLKAAPPGSILRPASIRTTDPPGLPAHCTTRKFSGMLHEELLKHRICCENHDFYLCLRVQPRNETDGDAGSQVDFDHVSTVCFTALVTTKLPTAVTATTQETGQESPEAANFNGHLVLLEIRDVSGHEPSQCPQHLCEEIFSNPTRQAAYFLNTFHLRQSHRRPSTACSHSPNPPSDPSVITLRQLVFSEQGSPLHRLDTYGQFLVAADLVNAVPSFHPSPWAHSWSTRSITYFRNLEKSDDIATWEPYIAGLSAGVGPLPCSTVLHDLSILLAEVAGVDMDTEIGEVLDHVTVLRKMRSVSRQLGKEYGDLVKRLYETSLLGDDVSVDDLCLEITRKLYAIAKGFYC